MSSSPATASPRGPLCRAALACALALVPYGGVQAADDLLAVYAAALKSDPSLKAAEVEKLIGHREYREAIYGYFPRVQLQLDASYRYQDIIDSDNQVFALGTADYTVFQYVVALTQPIIDYERYARIRQAEAQRERAFAEFAGAQQRNVLQVAEFYFTVLAAEKNLELVTAAREAAEAEHERARARARSGLAGAADLKEIEAEAELARSEQVDAEASLRDAREALRQVAGYEPPLLAQLKDGFRPAPVEPADPDQWVAAAVKYNQELKAQELRVREASLEYERDRGDYLPSLDFLASHDYTDQARSRFGGGSETNDTIVSLRLNVPLFNADGDGYGGIKSSLQHKATKHQYDQTRRAVERDARNLYNLATGAAVKSGALEKAVAAQGERVAGETRKFDAGQSSSVDLLEAKTDYLGAQRDLLEARFDYIVSLLRLKLVAGNLSERDLEAFNALLASE